MSNTSKRVHGRAEELGGKIKGAIGKLVGSKKMQAEGRAPELKGEAKKEGAKATERVKGKAEEAGGAVKSDVGELIEDTSMEAEGKAKELKGRARQGLNH